MDERLRLVAELQNKASAELKRLGKDMEAVKPSHGMVAAKAWMGEFQAAAGKVSTAGREIPNVLGAIGVGSIAAGFSLGELIKQFRDLADQLPALKELGRESGMSETQLARLKYAAEQFHVSGDKMAGSISGWSSRMVEFRRHTGRVYFEMLRGNADLAKKIEQEGPEEGFKDMLGWIARMPEALQRAGYSAADAAQVQKRWLEEATGTSELMPMLANGAKGLSSAYADAAKNVAPITPELQKQAELLNKSIADFDQSWRNFKNDVGPTIFKGLREAADDLRHVFDAISANPGFAAIAAGGAAAIYARHRIMSRSQTFGLRSAGTQLSQAAGELKGAAAALAGKNGGAPGSGPSNPGSGSSLGLGARVWTAAAGLIGIVANAPGAGSDGDADRKSNYDAIESFGAWVKHGIGLDKLSDAVHGGSGKPDANGYTHPFAGRPNISVLEGAPEPYNWVKPLNTDGNALHRNDEMPAGQKKDVTEAVKTGTLAAWREIAQQGDLGASGAGAANLRYGRSAGGDWNRTSRQDGPLKFAGIGHGAWSQAGASKSEVADYIRESAKRHGVDPDTAVRVAASEGLGSYTGDYGTSFGPYQLHYGGSGIRGMNSRGMGDDFTRDTHKDARDPKTWKEQIDYALGRASREGWGAWHGAAHVGIRPFQGIGSPVGRERHSLLTPSRGNAPERLSGELHIHMHEGQVRRMVAKADNGLRLKIKTGPTMVEATA